MGEGILGSIVHAVEGVFDKIMHDLSGGGSSSNGRVDNIRWEGMSNAQLAHAVQLLGQGPGASAMTQAADALAVIAQDLQQIDQTLHDQLQAIGVNWQSQASELAQEMTTASAAYGGSAGQAGNQSSTSMNQQADAYAAAKNAAPNPSTLQGDTQLNANDAFMHSLTGHSTDHAQQVAKTYVARQQTIDTLNNYSSASQTSLSSYQPLPQPPALNLQTHGVDGSLGQITAVQGFTGAPGSMPGAGGGGVPGVSSGAVPGVPGGALPVGSAGPGAPFGGPGAGGPGGLPGLLGGPGGMGTAPGAPNLPPGPVSGVGPLPSVNVGGTGSAAAAGAGLGPIVEDAAVGAAIVGGSAAAGAAGSAARRDELVRTRGNLPENLPGEETGARQQAANAIAELDQEEAAAAGVSARIGATAQAPPTMLEPAVAGRRAEEDDERLSRYAVDSDDMFGDGRMVVPPVLGSDPEPDEK